MRFACVQLLLLCLGPTEQSLAPADTPAAMRGTDIDVKLHALSDIQMWAHSGTYPTGIAGLTMATTSCNVGDVPVPWEAPMSTNHPFIVQNLYRLRDERLEQIGAAWLKHGFSAANSLDPSCGSCQNPGTFQLLGVGCSDTYGPGNNAQRNWLGPRDEVNPYTGQWDCVGSYFSGGQPDCVRRVSGAGLGPTDHMLEVYDDDLGDPSADYLYEAFYIVAGDIDTGNNIAWRTCTSSWTGSTWSFTTTSSRNEGPAIYAWGGEHHLVSYGEGDVILAAKANWLAIGQFHYEYALYNHNLDRQVRELTIPVDPAATVSNLAFRDIDEIGSNDWTASVGEGAVTWHTDTWAVDPGANSLRYGTLYNFSFDCDRVPAATTATLGLFKPGVLTVMNSPVTGPVIGPLDCNDNGIEDTQDLLAGTSQDCQFNGIPDDCEIADGTSEDCDADGVPDECMPAPTDCNLNGVPDVCDILSGASTDCQPNGVPDECETERPAEARVYEAAHDPGLSIPDDGGQTVLMDTIFVPEHGTIEDLNVALLLRHTFNGNLLVRLTQAERSRSLLDRPGYIGAGGGGYDNDGFDVLFDDSATQPIETYDSGGPMVVGTFAPNGLLAGFNGRDAYGEWRLTVTDLQTGDTGVLDRWSLQFVIAEQPGLPDCNGDLVPDECVPPGDADGDNVPDACDRCPGWNEKNFPDCDLDGVPQPDDCDDLDSLVRPGAPEGCGNGIDDDCDGDIDGDDADCQFACACGDLDGDGVVSLVDFTTLAVCFGSMTFSPDCPAATRFCADLNGDGQVNLVDFSQFAVRFGSPATGNVPDCGGSR